jgi:hypothetical protein
MNKLFAGIILSCVLFSCDIRDTKNKKDETKQAAQQTFTDTTTVQLIDSVYNFGTVTDGEKVEYSFRFRNTGKNSLIVTATHTSCGCTVSEKPEQPVKPGETGFIKVVFNSSGKVGDIRKEITVISNAMPVFPALQLTGLVKEKK